MSTESIFNYITNSYKRCCFTAKKQQAFLEDLSILINDGVPANRAIEMLAKIHDTGISKEVALYMSEKISEGKSLAEGARDWFSMNIAELIKAGEEGGALADTISSAAQSLAKRNSSLATIIGSLAYPLTILIMATIITVYLNGSIFKDFASIKPISQWPAAGQELVILAHIIQYWWWAFLLLLIAAFFGLKYLLFNYVGDLRSSIDSVPFLSLYRISS